MYLKGHTLNLEKKAMCFANLLYSAAAMWYSPLNRRVDKVNKNKGLSLIFYVVRANDKCSYAARQTSSMLNWNMGFIKP